MFSVIEVHGGFDSNGNPLGTCRCLSPGMRIRSEAVSLARGLAAEMKGVMRLWRAVARQGVLAQQPAPDMGEVYVQDGNGDIVWPRFIQLLDDAESPVAAVLPMLRLVSAN